MLPRIAATPFCGSQRARVEETGGRLPGAKEEDILLVANRDDLYLYVGSGKECIRICFKLIWDDNVALSGGDRQFSPGSRISGDEFKMIRGDLLDSGLRIFDQLVGVWRLWAASTCRQ